MRIAFLGVGQMGLPIAKYLARSGEELVVWNRSQASTEGLAAGGAKIAPTVSEAVADADVVFSMLMDDAAVEQVVLGAGGNHTGILRAMQRGAIHASLSTISVKLSKRLTEQHQIHGHHFVAAPVFGRPNVAAEGKLWIVVGGDPEHVAKIRPLLETFSRGITVVSEKPHGAHAFKIGGNFLITAMIESLSEAMVFAEGHSLDPALFLETVNTALFQSPFYGAYGKVMVNPPATPGATVALGIKDMRLFRDAAKSASVRTPLADKFADDLNRASEAGLGQADWAAGLYRYIRGTDRADG